MNAASFVRQVTTDEAAVGMAHFLGIDDGS